MHQQVLHLNLYLNLFQSKFRYPVDKPANFAIVLQNLFVLTRCCSADHLKSAVELLVLELVSPAQPDKKQKIT